MLRLTQLSQWPPWRLRVVSLSTLTCRIVQGLDDRLDVLARGLAVHILVAGLIEGLAQQGQLTVVVHGAMRQRLELGALGVRCVLLRSKWVHQAVLYLAAHGLGLSCGVRTAARLALHSIRVEAVRLMIALRTCRILASILAGHQVLPGLRLHDQVVLDALERIAIIADVEPGLELVEAVGRAVVACSLLACLVIELDSLRVI